jgi:hypothetical protein
MRSTISWNFLLWAQAQETLVADHPSRLASQHALAMAYRADGPVKKAVELLEHVVTVEGGFLRDDHPDRLASLTVLTYLHAEVRGASSQGSWSSTYFR